MDQEMQEFLRTINEFGVGQSIINAFLRGDKLPHTAKLVHQIEFSKSLTATEKKALLLESVDEFEAFVQQVFSEKVKNEAEKEIFAPMLAPTSVRFSQARALFWGSRDQTSWWPATISALRS